jgi:hypothetical protein
MVVIFRVPFGRGVRGFGGSRFSPTRKGAARRHRNEQREVRDRLFRYITALFERILSPSIAIPIQRRRASRHW